MRALTTRDALLILLEQGPIASQAEAARRLGVSRQAISQIVLAEGLDLRQAVRRQFCEKCSKRYYPSPTAQDGLCATCARDYRRVTMVCPRCGLSREVAPSVRRQRETELCRPCRRGIHRDLSVLDQDEPPRTA